MKKNYVLFEDEKQITLDGELIPYAVSKQGKVRNLKRGNYLKGSILNTYQYINFRWDGKQKNKAVHRLVAKAFIPNPENKSLVDHINGNRLDNRLENLRWATATENSNNKHPNMSLKHQEPPHFQFSEGDLASEKWKEHCGFSVSSLGKVIGRKGKELKGYKREDGYIQYSSILGHILVWEAFNGEKPQGMYINHINGNKCDNRLCNLELVSHKENMQKAANETNAWNFRQVEEFDDEGNVLNVYKNASDAARAIGILPGPMRNTIRRGGVCHNGLRYRYIDNE